LLSGRLDGLQGAPFDAGPDAGSPTLRPSQKRPRAPPGLALPMPALADAPRYEAAVSSGGGGVGDAVPFATEAAGWCGSGGATSGGSSSSMQPAAEPGALAPGPDRCGPGGDWRMVLYHDRNVVMYNPRETPPFRSRRLTSVDEAPGTTALSSAYGRCPLCRQTIDSRFAFAAQAYFDLLQGLFRNSSSGAAADPSDEVDVLAEGDLYRILGVSRKSTLEDVKRAYRKRSLRFHPDKNLDDVDAKLKFQKVAEAFSVLSDEHKRAKYDQSGDMDLEDFDVEQFMEMVNTSGLKYQKSPSASMDADSAEDFFEAVADGMVVGDTNPFLARPPEPVGLEAVVASDGGAEEEADAAANLQNVPAGLLNTGYYARFFVETQKLGAGSWGTVWLCRHVLDDLELGDYAVKKVPVGDNKAWLRDMIREVKTFERLHHPNIVEYKHSWLELSRSSAFCPFVPFLFILMQYCNAGSLDELIFHDGNPHRPKEPLPVSSIWHLLMDVLSGLQHLHQQGILHRDLKPTNILLQWTRNREGVSSAGSTTGVPRAMLSDFGTAAPFGEAPLGSAASRGYTGTVEYTAPELLQGGDREYTEKSDMWSLGIVLYAMCFSSLPWSHEDPSILKAQIRRFAEERGVGPQAGGGSAGTGASTDGSEDEAESSWLPADVGSRLGTLRLVLAALLELDAARRPSATDLVENPAFRGQAARFTRRFGDPYAALPDS